MTKNQFGIFREFNSTLNFFARSKRREELLLLCTRDQIKAVVFLKREKLGMFSKRVSIHGFITKRLGPNRWGVPIPLHVGNYSKGFSSMNANVALLFITSDSLVKSMEMDGSCYVDPSTAKTQVHMVAIKHTYAKPFHLPGIVLHADERKVSLLYGRQSDVDDTNLLPSIMSSGLETCRGLVWMKYVVHTFDGLWNLFRSAANFFPHSLPTPTELEAKIHPSHATLEKPPKNSKIQKCEVVQQ